MNDNFTLAIVGAGGIGGLLAGPLIRKYGSQISLVARGPRGEALRERGLTLHSDLYGEFTVRPATVAETPDELGVQDFILVCVKNGSLPEVSSQLVPIVGPDTTVMTVMNGVTAGGVLRDALDQGQVLESVIYTVASAGRDYSITQQGNFTQLFTGAEPEDEEGLASAASLVEILSAAGIEAKVSPNLQTSIWSKFVLNCAYNVATARWGCTIGSIKSHPYRMKDCRLLMEEAMAVGRAKGVALPDDLIDRNLLRIRKSTDDSASSLSRDFAAGRAGEMEVFSGDVVRMAAEAGVPVPVTEQYYQALVEIAEKF